MNKHYVITGTAIVTSSPYNLEDTVACLDDKYAEDEFHHYMGRILDQELFSKDWMSFRMEDHTLMVEVHYITKRELSQSEQETLIKYTSGQLSDGIGEGFEQRPCARNEGMDITISPWHMGQELEIREEE